MRRWLIALALALATGAIWAGAAFADDALYHGGYAQITNRCSGCHRTHTATGIRLVSSDSIYGLCTSCHGPTSGLSVTDGVEYETDASHRSTGVIVGALKGGGFEKAFMNTDLATVPTAVTTATSAHKVMGMTGYTGDTVWGLGGLNSGAGTAGFQLQCTTCHDPHGGSGEGGVATYRILRSNIASRVPGASGPVTVPDVPLPAGANAHDDFMISDTTTYKYYGEAYAGVSLPTLSQWCATCHTRIHASGLGSGSTSSGDSIYNFRHRTDGSNVSTSDANGAPACLTCHVAHGSSAVVSGRAAQVPKPGTAGGTGNTLDSSLLRVNQNGVCQLCHHKGGA